MQCKVLLIGCLGAAMLSGCGSFSRGGPDDGAPDAAGGDAASNGSSVPLAVQDMQLAVNRDLDVLFLVDDSFAMTDKQDNLAAAIPQFLAALTAGQDELPNLHAAVITSDLGTQGADDAAPGPAIGTIGRGGCRNRGKAGVMQRFGASGVTGPFLSDVADASGTRTRNYTGELAATLASMVKAGALGCGFEQPLEAIKQALLPTNTANAGFLRPDAALAVIVLSDEDDCSIAHSTLLTANENVLGPLHSFRCVRFGVTCDVNGATPNAMNQLGDKGQCHPTTDPTYLTRVGDYATFLKGLKADPSRVFVATISGALEPVGVFLRVPPGGTVPVPSIARSCSYTSASGDKELAEPPIRLQAFLDQFPQRSAAIPICQRDLAPDLQQLAGRILAVSGGRCLIDPLLDLEPQTPGLQYECAVSAVASDRVETALPRCTPEDSTASNAPCWHLVEDDTTCPSADHRRVVIEKSEQLAADTHLVTHCRI